MKISPLLTSLLALCAILFNAVPQTSAAEPPVALAFIVPADGQSLDAAMTQLAKRVVAAHPEIGPGQDPITPYRIDVVAGDYAAAEAALAAARKGFDPFSDPDGAFVFFHIVAAAMRSNTETAQPFEAAFEDAFRRLYVPLDDQAAAGVDYWTEVTYWLGRDPTVAGSRFRAQLQAQNGKSTIALPDAISLVSAYQLYQEQATTRPLMERLVSQDDERRYIVSDVLVKTGDGASLSAYVARSRTAPEREPAALFFTIYSAAVGNRVYAKYAAAHGYVGVIADARGKRLSTDTIRPFETEATDTHEVIDWIARQPWSDGQVGMWGGSYSGFAQWAALKHRPAALKTIVPFVADLPGDGLPMEHNVFLNANYAWNFYVMDNRFVDEPLYQQRNRWIDLPWNWFTSGRPYREIDAVDGEPNPLRQRQLKHPAYDAYWQAMVPYKKEFAAIDIPILEISGYSGADSVSDYFLPEHEHYNSKAEHYLVIGPYDHGSSQSTFKFPVLDGYEIDPVAQFDTPELTFQWFDHVMKGAPKPAIIQDRINFEVMGANLWRHAPSVDRMSDRVLTLYLIEAQTANRHRLSATPAQESGYVSETIDFADRKSINSLYPTARLSDSVSTDGALSFISDPVPQSLSINGQISGVLRTMINKRDMDFTIAVYEVFPDGRFFNLAYYLGRASYAHDMSHRRLLKPGKIETVPFSRTGIVSRQLSPGSRLLVLLTVNKNPFAQVNYGTGKDVSDESIADATEPLRVRWYNDSRINIPISSP
jgi:putative CocE/NonD family hydrolase